MTSQVFQPKYVNKWYRGRHTLISVQNSLKTNNRQLDGDTFDISLVTKLGIHGTIKNLDLFITLNMERSQRHSQLSFLLKQDKLLSRQR